MAPESTASKAVEDRDKSNKDREARLLARNGYNWMPAETESDRDHDIYYMKVDLDDADIDGPLARITATASKAAACDPADGVQFHLFPKLPMEVRLKIWSLQVIAPRLLIQSKPLCYKAKYTQLDSRSTPAVLHVCRESRNEFLYRENEAANNSNSKSHAMYARLFPDQKFKMSFFSFEVDAVHLMTFKVAEPVVRENLRTIVMGPSTHLFSFFKKFDEFRTPGAPTGNLLRTAVWGALGGSWYVRSKRSKHTLLIGGAVYPESILALSGKKKSRLEQALDSRQYIRYNFVDLLRFPALQNLVVIVSRQERMPTDPKKHIVWKTLLVIKELYPEFRLPRVEFLPAY